ncbi:MAG: DHHW family protein [Coriobacteriales bacterium]|nr:DHHW family protein [Coriobacteriales bacterium]
MRISKLSKILLIVLFLLVCLAGVLSIFFGNFLDMNNYENREMTQKPNLSISNLTDYPSQFEDYYSDNMPFRNTLVTLNSCINYFIFNVSSNPEVVPTKDNWLFYNNEIDGDGPIIAYQGKNLLSENELKAIADRCLENKNFLESQGKEYVVFIAPNKERIYGEYLEAKYGLISEQYRALQIYDYLKKNTDIRVLYPYDDLMKAKSQVEENIYFKIDTHWNAIGAYVGSRVLLNELGVNIPDIIDPEISIQTKAPRAGDLANMMGLHSQLENEDYLAIVDGYNKHDSKTLSKDFDKYCLFKATTADKRKLFVATDSYFDHMADYIGTQFNTVYSQKFFNYSYEDFCNQNPDIFVYAVVERNVTSLRDFSVQR